MCEETRVIGALESSVFGVAGYNSEQSCWGARKSAVVNLSVEPSSETGTSVTINRAVIVGALAPPHRPPRATMELAAARPVSGIHLLTTDALVG